MTSTSAAEANTKTVESGVLAECEYFTTEKIIVDGEYKIEVSNDQFEILIVCEGNATILRTFV